MTDPNLKKEKISKKNPKKEGEESDMDNLSEQIEKIEEEIIEEELQNEETTSKYEHLYTYCDQCKEHIFMNYDKSMVTNAKSFPVYYVWIHGKPLHGLLVRIDRNFVSRGERIVNLGFNLSSLQDNM